ncbi:MAG: hypothetical protein ABDH59_04040 [Fervidobacterium sp.]
MKKKLIITMLFLLFLNLFAASDIFNFVHKDYDFVLRISKGGSWYGEVKKVPFFSFMLDRKGLGFEDSFSRVLEDMRYKTGVLPDVVQDAMSNDILFASKGIEIDISNFVSFDINYYLEFMRNIAANSFIVFETKYPTQLSKALSYLLGVNFKVFSQNMYLFGDTLYASVTGKYFIIAGSKQTLELALKTFQTPEMQLARIFKEFDRLKAGTFFISGFSKPNTLKINLPGGIKIDDSDSEYLLFTSVISAGMFNFTIEQKNKKQNNTSKVSDNIGTLPLSWNYYICVPSKNTTALINSIEVWFSGVTSDLIRLTEFLKYIALSSTNVYVVGRFESGELVFIFDNFTGKDLELNIAKLGPKYDSQKQEWLLNFQNSKFYIYKSGNRLIASTIDKSKFEQYERLNKRLKDLPIYFDFSKVSTYDMKLFMDIGDIIKTTTGFNVISKLLFWQYSIGYLSYYKFIIS